jgi:hypothetical protein
LIYFDTFASVDVNDKMDVREKELSALIYNLIGIGVNHEKRKTKSGKYAVLRAEVETQGCESDGNPLGDLLTADSNLGSVVGAASKMVPTPTGANVLAKLHHYR